MLQDGPRGFQYRSHIEEEASKRAPRRPARAPRRCLRRPRRPERAPRAPREAQEGERDPTAERSPQKAHRRPQEAPKWSDEDPKSFPEGLKGHQETSKRLSNSPRVPSMRQNCFQEAPGRLPDCLNLAAGGLKSGLHAAKTANDGFRLQNRCPQGTLRRPPKKHPRGASNSQLTKHAEHPRSSSDAVARLCLIALSKIVQRPPGLG